MASRTFLVCVAALALAVTAHAQCSSSISCQACIDQSTCGWCDGECVEGSSSGSDNGECTSSAGTWSWGTCTPSSECSQNTDCTECTSASGCGWCSGSCVAGTSSGSDSGVCSASAENWYWTSCTAPADSCVGYDDCSDCTSEPGCGWCAATSTCMTGDYTGPSSGSCTGDDDQDGGWQYSTCADCDLYMDCSSCTGQSNCGWCLSSGSCLVGGSGGSADGSCPSDGSGQWSWGSDLCCTQYTDCGDCTSAQYCGWCGGQDSCYNGNDFGANGDNECFDDWTYFGETCDTAWTPGGVGFVLCYIVLPILCFVVCVRGCVYMCYRRRRTRYVPLAAAPAANVTVVATNVNPPAYQQQSGAYQQQLPPQQMPYGAASAPAPYYAPPNAPAYQGGYQTGGATAPPAVAPANYYAQPVPGYGGTEKNELPPA